MPTDKITDRKLKDILDDLQIDTKKLSYYLLQNEAGHYTDEDCEYFTTKLFVIYDLIDEIITNFKN